MVLQAKVERRQRHQAEKSCRTDKESHDSMLHSVDNLSTGHPQSIPPPSEPVLPAGKVLSPKAVDGPMSTEIAHQAIYFGVETVPEYSDIHAESSAQFTEDKSEARHSTAIPKGELESNDNYLTCLVYCVSLNAYLTRAF